MFDQILDNYRRATESTLQFQQQMMRNWTQQWPSVWGGVPMQGTTWVDQARAAHKKVGEAVTDMLNKHRETLDTQYRGGIRAIEDAFRLGEAKDPEQFRKLVEELWRQSFECLKNLAESQMRDSQTVIQKWFEVMSQGATGLKA